MPLSPGVRLGPYEIAGALGAGGMGEVYKARDPRLNRLIALKVLPAAFAADTGRRRRFEQEARAVAGLNHPNIVTLYSIEEDAGCVFLTMELVEGRTLSGMIPRKGLPLGPLLSLAVPLADAVDAAHQRGVTHRDLKPGNVMVTAEGRVKVLDFGLAKLRDETALGQSTTTAPAEPITGEGRIVGTVAYMSPEQAEGRAVDHRSDVFSLGVILYEMATGQRPFKGDTGISVVSAILKETPPLASDVNPDVPLELARVIRRCLTKDRDHRYQSAKDLRNELEELKQESDSGALANAPSSRRASSGRGRRSLRWWIAGAASVLVVAVLAGGLWWRARGGAPVPSPAAAAKHTQITFTGDVRLAALSPDGRTVAYAVGDGPASVRILVRDLGGEQALTLWRGRVVTALMWTPDGAHVAVAGQPDAAAEGAPDTSQVWLVPRLGGTPRRIPGLERTSSMAWSPDGSLIAGAQVTKPGFRVVPAAGGEGRFVPVPGIRFVHDLQWGTHSNQLALLVKEPDGQLSALVMTPEGREIRKIESVTYAGSLLACWSPVSDALYITRERNGVAELVRRPARAAETAPPEILATGLPPVTASCSVSADGQRMAHVRTRYSSNVWRADLEGPGQAPSAVTRGTSGFVLLHVSPDGRWVAATRDAEPEWETVRIPAAGGEAVALVRGAGATWSPDGRRLAFVSARGGKPRVWVGDVQGQDPVEVSGADVSDPFLAWLPDGRLAWKSPDSRNYVIRDLKSGREEGLVADPSVGLVFQPRFAPAGDRVAVYWNRRGKQGLWVLTWPGRAERYLAPLLRPMGWSADGKTIYAYAREGREVVKVDSTTGRVHPAVRFPVGTLSALEACDLSPDRRTVVCSLDESKSDVWVVDNFDPHVPRAKR